MINLGRTWPGVPQSMWPALNRLAEGVETALNWRTDGSLEVQVQGGYMTASVPPPTDFDTLILAGTNPYCWAKLAQFNDGKWYVDTVTPLVGWIDGYTVAAVADLVWNAGTAVITLQGVASVPWAVGTQVTIKGTNPVAWDQTVTITSIDQPSLAFQASIASDPGTYVTGGAVVGLVSGATAFRPGYEYNENVSVPAGARSRMLVHILNAEDSSEGADDAPEYEHQFAYFYPGEIPPEPLRPTFIPGYDGEDGDSYCIPGIPGERGPAGATGATGQGTAVPPGDKCEHDVWFGPWTPPGRNIACKLTGGTNTAVSPASTVSIQFETEVYDYDGMFVSTTNTRITIRTPGNYWVWGRARSSLGAVAPTAGGYQRLMLYKNGAATDFFQSGTSFLQDGSGDAYYCHLQVCEEDVCAAGDYFELFWKNGDASTNINIDKGNFGARKVDGAALPN